MKTRSDAEARRLAESAARTAHWKRWGPYLSERQWGTVREDYSPGGSAWDHFPHDHARSRAYRWGEDGIGGLCDRHQYVCFAVALWNERDPILKERLFGLTGPEGNHGEDVKECYYYLDSTPTHSYMKFLYKYPQAEFPYRRLVEENRRRGRGEPEFELVDTGVFAEDRYFDVFVEYAKADANDVLIRITVENNGPEAAPLHVLPTIWFRNTWSWGGDPRRPRARAADAGAGRRRIDLAHEYYGRMALWCEGEPELLFTENESNAQRLWGVPNESPFVKDGIGEWVLHGNRDAVNPAGVGSKAAAHYRLEVPPRGRAVLRLRLRGGELDDDAYAAFDRVVERRRREADRFYDALAAPGTPADARLVQRQAFAGLLWSKQFYHFDVERWLRGDPVGEPPAAERQRGRNHQWRHLYNADVISMPDKWEYPWYAAWDLAFHCVPLAVVDPEFAKQQLSLMLREWYMHPNGQLPAYEWALGDVNPPVHAWAARRVYEIDKQRSGRGDRAFLEGVFHKLLLNFTWWVNRKDAEGRNVFQGGFLGLDNIGIFDRSAPLPTGGHLEQADGTAWMGAYSLNMLGIALELARENPVYEDVASKFFEHFVHICDAMNDIGGLGIELWDADDGFYYDVLHLPDGGHRPLKIRSMVGLAPLFAVETLEPDIVDRLPGFKRRLQWFVENRPDLAEHIEATSDDGGVRRLLSLVNRDRLSSILRYMLDEREFLSPYGIRALSRVHREHPFVLRVGDTEHRVDYEPAESSSGLFGGNSNWRGPIWFPVNYLLIESLQKLHDYLGDSFTVELPHGSGRGVHLGAVASDLSRRLVRIFTRDGDGRRPVFGGTQLLQNDPRWRDLLLFHEYFHGDDGAGIGASHQTGWTALVATLIQDGGAEARIA